MQPNETNTAADTAATDAQQQQASAEQAQASGSDTGNTNTEAGEQSGAASGEGAADPGAGDTAAGDAAAEGAGEQSGTDAAQPGTDAASAETQQAPVAAANDESQQVVIDASTIELIPVDSKEIGGIGHRKETNTLAVLFNDRGGGAKLYHYANVDAELFDRLRAAESVWDFFFHEIRAHKDRFPYQRIVTEEAAQAA